MSRDPRRLFTHAERAMIAAQQQHACKHCNGNLPAIFHVHHMVSHANGGRTHISNGVAVCPPCHPHMPEYALPNFVPRRWQAKALPIILEILRDRRFATQNAAPGAGKTAFTSWVTENLFATEDIERLVIFVPNTHLRKQWQDELAQRGIYIRIDSITEARDEDGVVLTYNTLSDAAKLQVLINDAAARRTLIVADEVHHLAASISSGEAGSWAVNFARLVGTFDMPLHPVLNLSGTMFRSRKSERISTIRYRDNTNGTIDSDPDHSVTADELISEGILRHIKVLAFDAEMQVTAVNLATSTTGDP